ncbi:MAG: hypothetical protein WAM66_08900 [Acidobacteriaceae bacterium]
MRISQDRRFECKSKWSDSHKRGPLVSWLWLPLSPIVVRVTVVAVL